MDKKKMKLQNGEEIAYMEFGTSDEVLVLVHGNMSSSVHYMPLVEGLKKKFKLIIPDMRGFGDSTYVNRFDSLDDLAFDLLELLEKLKIKEYNVAGWSTGGAVAMRMAVESNVKHVVLIESCSHKGYPIFKKDENGAPILGSYYETKEELELDAVQVKPMLDVLASGATPIMKAVWDQAIYTVNKPSVEDDALYLSETMKQRNLLDIDWALTTFNMSTVSNGVSNGDGSIAKLTCPVISFWGDKDAVVLEYMIDETVNEVENIKKVVLGNSGHSPLVDCPQRLIEDIIEFIL